jgi:DNA-binding Lrp family transcriptional regulator
MVWALKSAPVADAQEHLVLIGLADHAAGDGSAAYPSKATLAEYARCSVRTVHNKLRRMEEAGIIVRGNQAIVAHIRADRRPVVYDLDIHGVNQVPVAHGVNDVPPVVDGVHERDARGEQPGSHGVNAVADKPSMNRTEPSSTPSPRSAATPDVPPDLLDMAFEAFWAVYPRKVGKQAARKALAAVVRDIAKETRQTVQLGPIVQGAQRMAADPNLPDEQFVPHAATWLRGRRWDDAPYPPRAGGRANTTDRVSQAMDVARRLAEADGMGLPPAIGGGS